MFDHPSRRDCETMATILAYTSPALGHLFPFSALLLELAARGHKIHLRTLSTGVEMGRKLGFTTGHSPRGLESFESSCRAEDGG